MNEKELYGFYLTLEDCKSLQVLLQYHQSFCFYLTLEDCKCWQEMLESATHYCFYLTLEDCKLDFFILSNNLDVVFI